MATHCRYASYSSQPRARGVVVVITLLSVLLLSALVIFVLNLGNQVNRRIASQDAADATALAASTWTARSLNMVAQNNVTMARTIALINVLDAMPQAAFNVEDESTKFHERLDEQLRRGLGETDDRIEDEVEPIYQAMLFELAQTLAEVRPVAALFDELVSRNEIEGMTHYSRNGSLWRQLYALDEANQAIMENLGHVVRTGAYEAGEAELDGDAQDSGTMLLPMTPAVPYERGQFNDFQHPAVYGTPPDEIDAMPDNRGPWDTVYGWRNLQSRTVGGEYIPGDVDGAQGGQDRGPGASGPGNDGRHVGGDREVVGYTTYGPRGWYLRRVQNFNRDHMPHTRLYMWVREISEIKLNRLWPGITNHYPHFHNTEWKNDYLEAKRIAEEYHRTRRLPRVLQTAYFMVEVKSKYPRGHARFMSQGTWALASSPRVEYFGPQNGPNHGTAHGGDPNRTDGDRGYAGWYDADAWGIERLTEWVWRNDWDYEVNWDTTIDIEVERDADDNPIRQTVYRYDYYIFAGANIDWDKQPSNPWAGFDPNAEDAPAPMNLNHNLLAADNDENRFRYLNALGVAHYRDTAQAWQSKFEGGKPMSSMVAIAQSEVFNNHSWDLWTQTWNARLVPVEDSFGQRSLEDWIARLQSDTVPEGVSPSQADALAAYFQGLLPISGVLLTH